MKNTITTKPLQLFVPFTRVDPEERIVEGYCYVNPKVKCDKWNLTRAAIEAAAAAYMEMPAVRAMHQNIAAGKALSVAFDDKGAFIRTKIVDDQEWNKVVENVYRGFSIGGNPTVARGNDIISFDWQETSLVDRPADPDALFTTYRAEGFDPAAEVEVEMLDEEAPTPDLTPEATPEVTPEGTAEVVRSASEITTEEAWAVLMGPNTFAQNVAGLEYVDTVSDLSLICGALFDNLLDIYARVNDGSPEGGNITSTQAGELMGRSVDEFAAYLHGWISDEFAEGDNADTARVEGTTTRGDLKTALERFKASIGPAAAEAPTTSEVLPETETTERLARLETAQTELLQRAETAETELTRVQGQLETATAELATATGEVERLGKLPARVDPAVRFPHAMERTFEANAAASADPAVATLAAELTRLTDEARDEPNEAKRQEAVVRMQQIKMRLATLGRG